MTSDPELGAIRSAWEGLAALPLATRRRALTWLWTKSEAYDDQRLSEKVDPYEMPSDKK